jgi:thiamine biosynthesis lipoprotein
MPCDNRRAAALISFLLIASFVQSSENQVLVYKKKYIMGTVFEIAAYDQSSEHASNAIERAFQEIVRLDDLMSNYKPDSALSNLNRSAHFHAEKVPSDLYRVIDQAILFSRLSDGKFDISIAPLVNLWKAALRGEGTPSRAQQEDARSCVGYEKIELSPPDWISFRSSCLQLDLGAIGKGYAVDRAAEVLHSLGIRDALINAGGSTIFAMGTPPDQTAWLVHLRDPSNKIDPQVMLKDGSVSTSEQTAPSLLGNDLAGHIIDPDTGMPLKTVFTVSAVSRTATVSDALSTALVLLGPTKGKELIKSMADVSAIWISREAQVETVTGGPQILFGRGLWTPLSLGTIP